MITQRLKHKWKSYGICYTRLNKKTIENIKQYQKENNKCEGLADDLCSRQTAIVLKNLVEKY